MVSGGAALTLTNIVVVNGSSAVGGAILNIGSLHLSGSTLSGNTASAFGGAILNVGTATASGSTFSGNAAYSGAAIANVGTLRLDGSTLANNTATGYGGGLFGDPSSAARLDNTSVSGNAAAYGAGLMNYGTLTLTGATIANNTAITSGGGLNNFVGGTTAISSSVFDANTAALGGGGIFNQGVLNLNNTDFNGNGAISGALASYAPSDLKGGRIASAVSSASGGGIYNDGGGVATFNGGTFRGNAATQFGGALINFGSATLAGSVLTTNTAYLGGAIANVGTAGVTDATLSGNTATLWGGALFNDPGGTATLANSTLSGNTALYGGGLYNYGTATLNTSTLSGNTAGYGGGIYHNFQATSLTNVTLSGNGAITTGGALMADFAGAVRMTNVTASNNAAPTGGGFYRSVGPNIVLTNTIVANSPTGGNCNGGVTSSRYSISSDGSCALGGTGDLNSVNPALLALGNYGGPTQTHLPLMGSPAVNAALGGGAPATDQRGVARPQGAAVDIGAVEWQASDTAFQQTLYLPLILR